MNTFSREFLVSMGAEKQVKKEIKMTTERLGDILEKHAGGREINFMSIDVEGMELSVLNSNDWNKFKPHVILLESFEGMNDEGNFDTDIRQFMKGKGYKLVVKTMNGIFFLRNDLKLNSFNHINYSK